MAHRTVQLRRLAHARSGDKGNTANIGIIAIRPEYYTVLVREVTVEKVRRHFEGICHGEVERFELPNLHALNFLLHDALGGGGETVTIPTGGIDAGWTFYVPFASTYSNTNVVLAIVGIFIAGFSSIFTGLNFIVSIHRMRAPG